MIDKVERKNCVGCKACGDKCPKKAIDYQIDKEGFWYPFIDYEKCIKCDICEKVCPYLNQVENGNKKEPDVYAVYSLDKEARYNSTSGGAYYEIAKMFLNNGGYIAGCVYDDGCKGAHHVIANDLNGLSKIMGSKYFQSDTEGIFEIVGQLLKRNEKVLFCGTPCQVDALNNYVEFGRENLYTIDFICRGINSPLAYNSFLEELENEYDSKVVNVHFKNKSHGWLNLGTKVNFENGKYYYKNRYTDPWVSAFIEGNLYMRLSCHNCMYRRFPRCSDLTLGDFWGLPFTLDQGKNGISVALINNSNGQKLIDMCKDKLWIEKRSLEEACNGNGALLNQVPIGNKRKEFFTRIRNESYSNVVWDILEKNAIKRVAKSIKENIKTQLWLLKNTYLHH